MKILKTVGLVALTVVTTVWHIQVLVWLWRWFVVRPFDLPQLGFLSMFGLSLFVGLFRMKSQDLVPSGLNMQTQCVNSLIAATLFLVLGLVTRGLIFWMGG